MTEDRAFVVGPSSARALLSIGIQEGLLRRARPRELDDGVFDRLSSVPVPNWLRTQLFQQLVLAPSVVMPQSIGEVVDGELLADGTIQFRQPVSRANRGAAFSSFAAAGVLGQMHANGYPASFAEVVTRLDDSVPESLYLEELLSKWGLGHLTQSPMSGLALAVRLAVDNSISKADKDEYRKRQSALDQSVGPILAALNEIEDVVALAENEHLKRVFIPRMYSAEETAGASLARPGPRQLAEEPEVTLLQVASSSLGRLPFGTSLAETLRMSNTAAADDLRTRLDLWVSELPNGSARVLRRIEQDTRRAVAGLGFASDAAAGARLMTYMGMAAVPASAILPIGAEIGVSVAVMGFGFQVATDFASRAVRWASFGER